MKKIIILSILVASLGILSSLSAETIKYDETISQANPQQFLTKEAVQQQAMMWGLTIQEYERYDWLLKHTPSGHWYAHLDPAEVLGLNTDNPKEQLKYAMMQAMAMHVRVTRELAFDRAYAHAYRELYPHEKPIMTAESNQK